MKIADRILLHLSRYYGHAIEVVAPWAMTQNGIASGVGAERKNVALPLNRLAESGHIAIHKRHIKGEKSIRKIYSLTASGMEEARRISRSFGETSVVLIDLEGHQRVSRMRDVATFTSVNLDMLDVALALKDGLLDCRQLQQQGARTERKLVDMTERMPVIKGFVGRSKELEGLRWSLQSKETKAVVVSGIPGIGKTSLVAEFLKDWKREHNVFWLKMHEWTGLRGLLIALGEFLSAQGKPALLSSITQAESLDLERIGITLRSEVSGSKGIAVIDDFHKGDERVREAVKIAFEILMEEDSDLKLILVGRSISAFFDARNSKLSRSVATIVVEELDEDSCHQILLRRGIPEIHHGKAMAVARGHPLSLQLFDPASESSRPSEFYDFVEREVSVSLTPLETGIMTASALARYPLAPDAFLSSRIAYGEESGQSSMLQLETDVNRSLISLKEKNLIIEGTYDVIDSHDLLKDFFKKKASGRLRKSVHLALSQFYVDGDSPFSANEAIYHLIEADDLVSALEVAKLYGNEILERVGCFTLHAFLEASLASKHKYLGEPGFLLLSAEIYEMDGNLDSALDALKRISSPGGRERESMVVEALRLQGNILTRRGDLQKAQDSFVRGKEIASHLGDARLRSSISCDLGNLYHKLGQLGPARENLEDAMKGAEETGDDVLKGRSLYGIAKLVAAEERYEEAISIEGSALEILRQTGALSDQAKILSSMGTCYDAIGKYDEALKCQDEAYDLSVRAGDVYTQGCASMNASATLLKSGHFDDAKMRIDRASSIATKTGDVPMLSFLALMDGKIRAEEGDWGSAESYFSKCIELAEKSGQKYYNANWRISIGNFYASHGKKDVALNYLLSAKEICESNALKDLMDYVSQQISAIDRGHV